MERGEPPNALSAGEEDVEAHAPAGHGVDPEEGLKKCEEHLWRELFLCAWPDASMTETLREKEGGKKQQLNKMPG